MKIIDLSHTIHDGIQIYPGDPEPGIKPGLTHEKDYCHVDLITLGSHTGTHIDAPYHFLADGRKIDEIAAGRFVGNGVLVDVTFKADRELIDSTDVEPFAAKIKKGNFVIFQTGRDKFFGTTRYYLHPYLSAECARYLLKLGVGLVGIDAMNIDPTYLELPDLAASIKKLPREAEYGYPVHDLLLGNDILIVENLCNLDRIQPLTGLYSFLPLKLKGSDGSPIRAVFIQN